MALPLIYPAVAFLGMAMISAVSEAKNRWGQRKSIEVCTAELKAAWMKEDGILQIYHESLSVDCTRIVVECSGAPPLELPSEVRGHPVLVRYGVVPTGASGIRGISHFTPYTSKQMDAIRRDDAAQGWTGGSVAP